jgi:hypothetical protein
MGAIGNIPDWVKNSKSINALPNIKNNMCFWACLAVADGARADRCTNKAKEIYRYVWGEDIPSKYNGFNIGDIEHVETMLQCGIQLWQPTGKPNEVIVFRRSSYEDPITLLWIPGNDGSPSHVCLVTNPDTVLKSYRCDICDKMFTEAKRFNQHYASCSVNAREVFPKFARRFTHPRNIILEVCEALEIEAPQDIFYDFVVAYDFEAMLRHIEARHGEQLTSLLSTSRFLWRSLQMCLASNLTSPVAKIRRISWTTCLSTWKQCRRRRKS